MKLKREIRYIDADKQKMKIIILKPENLSSTVPGILWIHGGGYALGMAEMVYVSCGKMLAEKYGAIVVSPEYRLSTKAIFPAAMKDCYTALEFMDSHRKELGIDSLIVGGESAGGGLAAAICLYARDHSSIRIDYQLPLYPMLDCQDTESSMNNKGKIWNTRRNHWGWKKYLGSAYQTDQVSRYASVARESDYHGLPPCYTFVCDGEPFYNETITYINHLKEAGIEAEFDVYHGDIHAFDMVCFWTRKAKKARNRLCEIYETRIVRK